MSKHKAASAATISERAVAGIAKPEPEGERFSRADISMKSCSVRTGAAGRENIRIIPRCRKACRSSNLSLCEWQEGRDLRGPADNREGSRHQAQDRHRSD